MENVVEDVEDGVEDGAEPSVDGEGAQVERDEVGAYHDAGPGGGVGRENNKDLADIRRKGVEGLPKRLWVEEGETALL